MRGTRVRRGGGVPPADARLHPQPPWSASFVRTLDVRLTSVRFLGNQVRAC